MRSEEFAEFRRELEASDSWGVFAKAECNECPEVFYTTGEAERHQVLTKEYDWPGHSMIWRYERRSPN